MGAALDSFRRWRFRVWGSRLLRKSRSVHDTGHLSAGPFLEDLAEDRSDGGQLGVKDLSGALYLGLQRLKTGELIGV